MVTTAPHTITRVEYRRHLRQAVAASAGPYGYTLTLWTGGAVTSHAHGIPGAPDALLLLLGAVGAFALVAAFAYSGIRRPLAEGGLGPAQLWAGFHILSVGSSVLAVWAIAALISGHLVWLVTGFAATAIFLLGAGLQLRMASR